MKRLMMAALLGGAFLAAPAAQACDMDKADSKVMKQAAEGKKAAKNLKSGKAAQKTAAKKAQTSKI